MILTSPETEEQVWVRKSMRRGTVASLANPRLRAARTVDGMRSHTGKGTILSLAILKEYMRGNERKERKEEMNEGEG